MSFKHGFLSLFCHHLPTCRRIELWLFSHIFNFFSSFFLLRRQWHFFSSLLILPLPSSIHTIILHLFLHLFPYFARFSRAYLAFFSAYFFANNFSLFIVHSLNHLSPYVLYLLFYAESCTFIALFICPLEDVCVTPLARPCHNWVIRRLEYPALCNRRLSWCWNAAAFKCSIKNIWQSFGMGPVAVSSRILERAFLCTHMFWSYGVTTVVLCLCVVFYEV